MGTRSPRFLDIAVPLYFKPDRSEMKRRRLELGLSLRALASTAGVDHKTLAKIEDGRTSQCEQDTLQFIASALEQQGLPTLWKQLVADDTMQRPVSDRLLDTRETKGLKALALVERNSRPQPITTERGVIPIFGPSEMDNYFTAYAIRRGAKGENRFYITGEVTNQYGLSDLEATMFGLEGGHGARFEVSRSVGKKPFRLTVYTVEDEHTTRFQDDLCPSSDEVSVVIAVVRVVFTGPVKGEPDSVSMTDLSGGSDFYRPAVVGGDRWSGFAWFNAGSHDRKSDRRHPWTLVVESIVDVAPFSERREGSTLTPPKQEAPPASSAPAPAAPARRLKNATRKPRR